MRPLVSFAVSTIGVITDHYQRITPKRISHERNFCSPRQSDRKKRTSRIRRKSCAGRRGPRPRHCAATLRRFGRLLGNTPVSNRALPLSAAVPRRRRTERHLSASSCASILHGASRTKFCWGFQRVEGEDDSLENCKKESKGGAKRSRKKWRSRGRRRESERRREQERERESAAGRGVRCARVV